jgi:hypothetical protein
MPRNTPEGGPVTINSVSDRVQEPLDVNSTDWVDVNTVNLEVDGTRPLMILVSFVALNDSAGSRTFTGRLTYQGAPAGDELPVLIAKGVSIGAQLPITYHFYTDTIPKGAAEFKLQIKSDSTLPGQSISERRLTVVEF